MFFLHDFEYSELKARSYIKKQYSVTWKLQGKELTKEKAEKKKLKKEHEEYGKVNAEWQKYSFLVKASEDTFNKYKDTSSRKFEEMNIAFTKLKDEHHSEVLALYKQIAFLHEQPQRKQPRLEAGSSMSF